MNPTKNESRAQATSLFRVCEAVVIILLFATLTFAKPTIVLGPGAPHVPVVKRITIDSGAGTDQIAFQAYRTNFSGGVRVAAGDVNGDGVADIITGPGPGMGARIRVFDGITGEQIRSFLAFPGFLRQGVFVAAGDVNGDGKADIIVAPDKGAPPIVRVFDGASGNAIKMFLAYPLSFLGGVRVGAGDVNGDGVADIITGAGPGGGPHVKVFNGVDGSLLRSFFAFDPSFQGGVFVAAGDVNGDGYSDIVIGPGAGTPQVKVFDGNSNALLRSFLAYGAAFRGGVTVAAGDVNGDGYADVVTGAGPGGAPQVKVFDGVQLGLLQSFLAYEPSFLGGIYVGAVGSTRPQAGR